jgi:hypothetical protein
MFLGYLDRRLEELQLELLEIQQWLTLCNSLSAVGRVPARGLLAVLQAQIDLTHTLIFSYSQLLSELTWETQMGDRSSPELSDFDERLVRQLHCLSGIERERSELERLRRATLDRLT